MKKSVFLVIVFLSVFATSQAENELRDLLKKWIGSQVSGACKWGDGDDYPGFDRGQQIEMLEGCYKCSFDDDCSLSCVKNPKGPSSCDKRPKGVCQWTSAGLPKMMPREDVYRDDTHVCEFSVMKCKFMCWNFASENARRRRLETLLEELTEK